MIKLIISSLIFILIFSCKTTSNNKITNVVVKGKEAIANNKINNVFVKSKQNIENKIIKESTKSYNDDYAFYYIGETYYIEGVKYSPKENYNYTETGLASFYGKELHNIKTINYDLNKVTELLGRHKTLPLPSVVKVTNLENGLSITIKIIDRFEDNTSIIQLSRKAAQLLKFYKNKIARVKIDILPEPSKQWKRVLLIQNEPNFDLTMESAPTDSVSITNLEDSSIKKNNSNLEKPIEIGFETIKDSKLFIKIYQFNDYEEISNVLKDLNSTTKATSEKTGSQYNLILGPIKNEEADKLVSYFIGKGYKNTEIFLD